MPPSTERRRLLNQAVHGFLQRHPEATIAGVELDIAETLHVSQASVQKWRAGHPISLLHVPALAEWAVRRAGMSRTWLLAFLRACEYASPSAVEEALFDQPYPYDLAAACRAAHLRFWGSERMRAAFLHFPRPGLVALLHRFLLSDRPGLILISPSGMGKTDFSLWLARQQMVRQYFVLACPAALLDGSRSLPEILNSLLFPDRPLPPEETLTWPLLLVLDGVNESPDMVRLTWQVDRALVHAGGLKVLLTFRPESFQIVRRAIPLGEHLYYTDPQDIANILVRDPPAFRLLPFSPDELPPVYETYCQVYSLRTPFHALPPALKAHLRHPLILRLVAETWADRALPEKVETDRLMDALLNTFYRQGRLSHTDLRFLEERLLPRMVAPDRWCNAIPVQEVLSAGETERGNGPPSPYHPFTRLADVGLLASTNGRLDDPIRFAHEHFYEHFAWRYLVRMRESASDPVAFYAELADIPWFLHVPLRRLVAKELVQLPDPRLWAALASLPEPVLIGALEDRCRAHPEEAPQFLRNLWHLRPLRRRVAGPLPSWAQNAQRALIAAAAAIGAADLLADFLRASTPAVQPFGIIRAKDLWASNPLAAEKLLRNLADRIPGPVGLPNPGAVSLFAQVFLLSLFDYGQQTPVRSALQSVIKDLARQALHGLRGRMLLYLAARWMTSWLKRAAVEANLTGNLEADFRLSPEEREHLRALARYIDWETPGFGSEETWRILRAGLEMGSLLMDWLIILCIVIKGLGNPEEGLSAIRRLLADTAVRPCPPWVDVVLYATMELLRRAPVDNSAIWEPLESGVAYMLENYPSWHMSHREYRRGRPQDVRGPAQSVAPYVLARDAAGLPVEAGPVWKIIRQKLARGDPLFALDYLREMYFVALDGRRPRLALRLIEPLAGTSHPEILPALADLLSIVQSVDSEDVRDFLERTASPSLVSRISLRSGETPTSFWLYYRVQDYIYSLLLYSPSLRLLMSRLFILATDSSSVQEWLQRSALLILETLGSS